jgi:hypothetical protein
MRWCEYACFPTTTQAVTCEESTTPTRAHTDTDTHTHTHTRTHTHSHTHTHTHAHTHAELSNVLLDETPWVRDSLREAESRSRVATLLREDTIVAEIGALTAALKSYQNGDGGFPWIPGGGSDACVASIHLLLP